MRPDPRLRSLHAPFPGPSRQRGAFGFLSRLLGRRGGLDIRLKDDTLRFGSVQDFKLFLHGKTEIPAAKLQEMLRRPTHELREEHKQLQKVERTIMDKLAATIRDPGIIDQYLSEATLVRFSQDYDWRQIIYELSQRGPEAGEYKLEAVTHYLNYLRSRMGALAGIQMDRARQHADGGEEPDSQSGGGAAFASTRSIDLSRHRDDLVQTSDLKRLPRGQAVPLITRNLLEVQLRLATRPFILRLGAAPMLAAPGHERYPLHEGDNVVGRSSQCSIIVDASLVDISRQHLIITLGKDGRVSLTDLSSSGSFVQQQALK
jgi:hypothetical protein